MVKHHESVLVKEVIDSLHITKSDKSGDSADKYIDATLGNGGHSIEILKEGGMVLGIDMDPEMIKMTEERIGVNKNFKAVRGNFKDLEKIAKENDWTNLSGIIFDLGVSNIHLKDLSRGFSFENDQADLDMRLDPLSQGVKASDLLNVLRSEQLEDMFKVTLEPGAARWITNKVVQSRLEKPFKTVGDFLEVCEGLKTGKPGLNVATLPFLALRIAVNSELDNLKEGLVQGFNLLKTNGRLAVISFHSGEDEIVKEYFKFKCKSGLANSVYYKPVMADEGELQLNKRARSAKLRVIEKI